MAPVVSRPAFDWIVDVAAPAWEVVQSASHAAPSVPVQSSENVALTSGPAASWYSTSTRQDRAASAVCQAFPVTVSCSPAVTGVPQA